MFFTQLKISRHKEQFFASFRPILRKLTSDLLLQSDHKCSRPNSVSDYSYDIVGEKQRWLEGRRALCALLCRRLRELAVHNSGLTDR